MTPSAAAATPVAPMRSTRWTPGSHDPSVLVAHDELRTLLHDAATAGGARVLGDAFHVFPNGAVTGALLLAQSHLSIHTWPEGLLANVDLLSCGRSTASRVMTLIAERPRRAERDRRSVRERRRRMTGSSHRERGGRRRRARRGRGRASATSSAPSRALEPVGRPPDQPRDRAAGAVRRARSATSSASAASSARSGRSGSRRAAASVFGAVAHRRRSTQPARPAPAARSSCRARFAAAAARLAAAGEGARRPRASSSTRRTARSRRSSAACSRMDEAGALDGRRVAAARRRRPHLVAIALLAGCTASAPAIRALVVVDVDAARSSAFVAAERSRGAPFPIEVVEHDLREPLPDRLRRRGRHRLHRPAVHARRRGALPLPRRRGDGGPERRDVFLAFGPRRPDETLAVQRTIAAHGLHRAAPRPELQRLRRRRRARRHEPPLPPRHDAGAAAAGRGPLRRAALHRRLRPPCATSAAAARPTGASTRRP